MIESVRYIAAADVALLLFCGAAVRASHAQSIPRVLDVLALLYGSVFAAVGVGVLANTLTSRPPTPGVWVLVIVATPVALIVAVLTVRTLRQR